MKQFIGAIDQGTTSTRFIVFDHKGSIVSAAQEEHRQIYSNPGWIEHDPEEIWEKTCSVAEKALRAADISPDALSSIGVTNQRETTLIWSRSSSKPLYNALVWLDTRTKDICEELSKGGLEEEIRSITGLPITTYFSASKILWLKKNVPEVEQAMASGDAMIGTIDSWLLYKLTSGRIFSTDSTNASRTMLMNLSTLKWDESLLSKFSIPVECLPSISPSQNDFGIAEGNHPLTGVRIGSIIGDQQSSLFGQLCIEPGDSKCTYGTGCFMMMNIGQKPIVSSNGLVSTVAFHTKQTGVVYALEGSIAVAGSLVQWLRDQMGLISESAEVEKLAINAGKRQGSEKDVYFVPAFSGLFAPYWRQDARGAIVGMTHRCDRNELARAALDSTAYQVRDVAEAMTEDVKREEARAFVSHSSLRVDGGMTSNNFLMQFQADVLGKPVIKPRVAETTALGAAYTAGLSTGFWSSIEELKEQWQEGQRWTPSMDSETRSDLYRGWKKAVEKSFSWVETK